MKKERTTARERERDSRRSDFRRIERQKYIT